MIWQQNKFINAIPNQAQQDAGADGGCNNSDYGNIEDNLNHIDGQKIKSAKNCLISKDTLLESSKKVNVMAAQIMGNWAKVIVMQNWAQIIEGSLDDGFNG